MISKLTLKLADASEFDKIGRILFAAGFTLGVLFCFGYQMVLVIPIAALYGLLCFGCGITLMQFLELRRCSKASMESLQLWTNSLFDLSTEQSKLEQDRASWEEEKAEWLEVKEATIKKEALALLEKEATRRGGEQIERDMSS